MSAAFLRDTMDNLIAASRHWPAHHRLCGLRTFGRRSPAAPASAAQYALRARRRQPLPHPPALKGFGRCLLHAMQALFAQGHPAACVLSSDTPTLPTAILTRTAAAAAAPGDARRVVLGACDDGGYYLLGMRTLHAGLFADIAWSTGTVADATRRPRRSSGAGADRAAALVRHR